MRAPYGDESRTTRTQALAWDFLQKKEGDGPLIAMIGAKGSSKTHLGAAFAVHMGQKYPGSTGMLVANTYKQVNTSIIPILKRVAESVGLPFNTYTSKKIDGQPHSTIAVLCEGTPNEFYVLMRSFENIETIEGAEPDWLWVEECQDADKDDFVVAFSRIRGKKADNSIYIAGMPDSPFHWQYILLPKLGFVLEGEKGHGEDGVMFWPKLVENEKNLPKNYIKRMKASHTGDMARRYIEGLPSLIGGSLVCYQYDDYLHRRSLMSELLCKYDQHLPLIFAIDFNVRQMCCSVWQEKPWNDKWGEDNVKIKAGEVAVWETVLEAVSGKTPPVATYDSLEEYAAPNRYVLAQVDEIQLFSGGTRALAEKIVEKYSKHGGGMTLLGDASGNAAKSSSDTTDWKILEGAVANLPNVRVIRGLKSTTDLKTGKTTYSNPSVSGSINILNYYLRDGHDKVRLCVLPESKEENNGVAGSMARIEHDMSGKPDARVDKDAKPEDAVTHWLDGARYLVVWHNGGDTMLPDAKAFDQLVQHVSEESKMGGSESFSGVFS